MCEACFQKYIGASFEKYIKASFEKYEKQVLKSMKRKFGKVYKHWEVISDVVEWISYYQKYNNIIIFNRKFGSIRKNIIKTS